jgi:methionine-rich copper-binding protein CopC
LHTIVAVTGMQHVTARRAAIALALGLLLACAAPAVAHDELVASRPVDSALLAAPPRALALTFSNPLGEAGAFTVRSPAGQTTYRARLDPANARRMIASLPPGEPGAYAVTWTAISADGHTITGDLAFEVRASPLERELAAVVRALERAGTTPAAGVPFSWTRLFG